MRRCLPNLADLVLLGALTGCAHPSSPPSATPAQATSHPQIQWAAWDSATFHRARDNNRLILINVVAEWCHWCHVMEAETYANPEVAEILRQHFVTIRVDSDARPDIAERYRAWGWPATGILSPDAGPVLELRGFQNPAEFAKLLRSLVADRDAGTLARRKSAPPTTSAAGGDTELSELRARVTRQLDHHYDSKTGGWGEVQKYPFSSPVEHAMVRTVVHNNAAGKDWRPRVTQTLGGETHLIDPVWGGMYQYSLRHDWDHPHYEKITKVQAGAIANFAMAARLTGDPRWLHEAAKITGYMRTMLRHERGGFFTSQDADVRRDHEITVVGLDYYAKNDQQRRVLGMPRIDNSVYADNNGLMILALTELYRATGDGTVLADAIAAAEHVLAEHRTASGAFTHGEADETDGLLFLRDQVTMGRALLGLFRVTGDPLFRDLAKGTGDFMLASLADPRGGFFAQTVDPAAVGSLAVRRKPLEENGIAARFLLELHRYLDGDGTLKTPYGPSARQTLLAVGGGPGIKARGRLVGEYLLALESATMTTVDITVVGVRHDPTTQALLLAALKHFEPRGVVSVSPPGERYPDTGNPAIFLCTTSACSSPVRDADEFDAKAARFVANNL